MVLKKSAGAIAAFSLLIPGMAAALVVEIQGVRLEPEMVGASCVNITGVYPGVRIEADRPGQTPRICHSAGRVNSITLSNATLIATAPIKKEIAINFGHEFPPGVNGKIMARAKLRGFFATDTGVGSPKGDHLVATALFFQGVAKDVIGEALDFTVGETLDSALFDHSVKKQYLVAGPRALKGEMKITFTSLGHKVTFPDKCSISLDSGSRLEDKLETLEPVEGEEAAPTDEGAIPLPAPPGGEGAGPQDPSLGPQPLTPALPPDARLPPAPEPSPMAPVPPDDAANKASRPQQ